MSPAGPTPPASSASTAGPATGRSAGDRPLVTVITPAYNRATLIAETIESVLSQEYPNLEYLVLDDGSKDGTLAEVRKYEGRLRIEAHPNMGETRTVNRGFELARGEIIGVVNSDDPLLPGAVTALVDALQSDPALLVAYPDWRMIDEHGREVRTVETYPYSYEDMLRWHHCFPGPGAFFRRSVVERLGGRDATFRYVGDFDFWLRAGLLGPFVRVPRVLATFRHHADSASVGQKGQKMADEHIVLVERLFARPDLPPAVRTLRAEAFSSAAYIAGCVCGEDLPQVKKRFFLDAIRHHPRKYLGEYRPRLSMILPHFPKVHRLVRMVRAPFRPILDRLARRTG